MPVPASCAGCGRCCVRTAPHLDVLVSPDDPVPVELTEIIDGLRWMRRRPDQACVALYPVSKLCRIYDRRPQGCREFAFQSRDCEDVCR